MSSTVNDAAPISEQEVSPARKLPTGIRSRADLLQSFALLGVLVLLVAVLAALNEAFLTWSNFLNVLRQISVLMLGAVGETLIILSGGFDLSIGSMQALASSVTASVMLHWGIGPAILLGLLVGVVGGLLNGVVITKIRVNPLVATLGTMSIFRGFALITTGGDVVFGLPSEFLFLGTGFVGGVPVPAIFAIAALVVGFVLLRMTVFGLNIYAIGGNREAARLSGIKVDRVLIACYTIGGLLAALSGVIMTARLSSGQPTLGHGFELNAIAAVVIGGTSLSGGAGGLGGTIIGVFLIGVLSNGLNILNVNYFWQQVIIGSIIIMAVAIDNLRHRR